MAMPKNPDPKRFALKKLYGGEYRLVDKQILRWRKYKKRYMTRVPPPARGKERPPEASLPSKSVLDIFFGKDGSENE